MSGVRTIAYIAMSLPRRLWPFGALRWESWTTCPSAWIRPWRQRPSASFHCPGAFDPALGIQIAQSRQHPKTSGSKVGIICILGSLRMPSKSYARDFRSQGPLNLYSMQKLCKCRPSQNTPHTNPNTTRRGPKIRSFL